MIAFALIYPRPFGKTRFCLPLFLIVLLAVILRDAGCVVACDKQALG